MWQIIAFSLLGGLLAIVLVRNLIIKQKIIKFYKDKSRKGVYKKIIKQEINKYFVLEKNNDYFQELEFKIKTNLFATVVYVDASFNLLKDGYIKNIHCRICFDNKTTKTTKESEMIETLKSVNLIF